MSSRPNGDRPVWKMFSKIKVPRKIKICAWKLLVGGLPTRETKVKKHMERESMCQRCGCVWRRMGSMLSLQAKSSRVMGCDEGNPVNSSERTHYKLRSGVAI